MCMEEKGAMTTRERDLRCRQIFNCRQCYSRAGQMRTATVKFRREPWMARMARRGEQVTSDRGEKTIIEKRKSLSVFIGDIRGQIPKRTTDGAERRTVHEDREKRAINRGAATFYPRGCLITQRNTY